MCQSVRAGLVLVGLGGALTLSAGPAGADEIVTGRVSVGVLTAGQRVAFGGDGFAPASLVTLTAEGAAAGRVRADRSGAFSTGVVVTGRPGFRALAGRGVDRTGRIRIVTATVRITAAVAAPASGSPVSTEVALVAGFGLVAATAAGRLVVRPRRAGRVPA